MESKNVRVRASMGSGFMSILTYNIKLLYDRSQEGVRDRVGGGSTCGRMMKQRITSARSRVFTWRMTGTRRRNIGKKNIRMTFAITRIVVSFAGIDTFFAFSASRFLT